MPLQSLAAKFLMSMKEYPPSQTPGSFNLDKILKAIESGEARAGRRPIRAASGAPRSVGRPPFAGAVELGDP